MSLWFGEKTQAMLPEIKAGYVTSEQDHPQPGWRHPDSLFDITHQLHSEFWR